MKFEKNVEKLETFRIEVEKLKSKKNNEKFFFLITESIFYFYLFHFFV